MIKELKRDKEIQLERKKRESDATNLLHPEMEEEVDDRSANSQPNIIGDDSQSLNFGADGVSDEVEFDALPFSFLKPHLVQYITDVNTLMLEPSDA